jgi:hypothetical protein
MKERNRKQMKTTIITAFLLAAICASVPYLYGDSNNCVGQKTCYHDLGYKNIPDQLCQGDLPELKWPPQEGDVVVWLAGSSPCGTIWDQFGFHNTNTPCGDPAIVTECA